MDISFPAVIGIGIAVVIAFGLASCCVLLFPSRYTKLAFRFIAAIAALSGAIAVSALLLSAL